MNGLPVQLCQDVCKVLHPTLFTFSSACMFRFVGNADGLNRLYAFSLSSSNPLLECTLVVLRIYRDEHHGLYLF